MRKLVLCSLVVATPAFAEPAPCAVTVVRAPDDVRVAIDQALAREPCAVALEVRAVPTDGGIYLLARDDRDRVRERVVPDARAASVLVASWAADNALPPQPALVVPHTVATDDTAPAGYRRPERERWLELYVMYPLGGRAVIDLATTGKWSFGATAELSDRPLLEGENWYNNTLASTRLVSAVDARALGHVAHTFGDGLWTIRTAIAAGVVATRIRDATIPVGDPTSGMQETRSGVFPMGEVSIWIGRDVGAGWGVDAGLVIDLLDQQIHLSDTTLARGIAGELGLGLRHRL